MKRKILIIPAAAYKKKYEDFIPEIFMLNMFGEMNLIHNMKGLPLDDFEKIYITINKQVDDIYHIKKMIETQLSDLEISEYTEVIVIDKTKNVVETIVKTLEQIPNYNDCGIFIKDADASFIINELNSENTVYTYMLEDVIEINPSSKSYVATTSDDVIMNIIEKRVISSEFCAGGYYFDDVRHFINLCEDVEEYDKLYLSNVIYYDILRNNEMHRTEQVVSFSE